MTLPPQYSMSGWVAALIAAAPWPPAVRIGAPVASTSIGKNNLIGPNVYGAEPRAWLVRASTALVWDGSTGPSVQAAMAAIAARATKLRTRILNPHDEGLIRKMQNALADGTRAISA